MFTNHQEFFHTLENLDEVPRHKVPSIIKQCRAYLIENFASFSSPELCSIYACRDMKPHAYLLSERIAGAMEKKEVVPVLLLETLLSTYGHLEQSKIQLVKELDRKNLLDFTGSNHVASIIKDYAPKAGLKHAVATQSLVSEQLVLAYMTRNKCDETLLSYCALALEKGNMAQAEMIFKHDKQALAAMIEKCPHHGEMLMETFLNHYGNDVLEYNHILTNHEEKVLRFLENKEYIGTYFLRKHDLNELPSEAWKERVIQASIDRYIKEQPKHHTLTDVVIIMSKMGEEYFEKFSSRVNMEEFFNHKMHMEHTHYQRDVHDEFIEQKHTLELNALQYLVSGNVLHQYSGVYNKEDKDYSFFARLMKEYFHICNQPIKEDNNGCDVLTLLNYYREANAIIWVALKNHELFSEQQQESLVEFYIERCVENALHTQPIFQDTIHAMSPEGLQKYEKGIESYGSRRFQWLPDEYGNNLNQLKSLVASAQLTRQLNPSQQESACKTKPKV